MSIETGDDYDLEDVGRVAGIAAAAPGWWVVYDKGKPTEWRCPVAAWVVTEATIRMAASRKPRRCVSVYGVDPTGEGWTGEVIEQECEYVFDPTYVQSEPGETDTPSIPKEVKP